MRVAPIDRKALPPAAELAADGLFAAVENVEPSFQIPPA